MSETLVVVSKVKAHIKAKSGLNCSQSFIDALSREVERECAKAVESAQQNKRKTVMDRDLEQQS